jgi:hypothetical protein
VWTLYAPLAGSSGRSPTFFGAPEALDTVVIDSALSIKQVEGMVNPRGRMKTGAQWYLLALCILWAFAGVRSAGPPTAREASLREAEERLDDLR